MAGKADVTAHATCAVIVVHHDMRVLVTCAEQVVTLGLGGFIALFLFLLPLMCPLSCVRKLLQTLSRLLKEVGTLWWCGWCRQVSQGDFKLLRFFVPDFVTLRHVISCSLRQHQKCHRIQLLSAHLRCTS